MPLSTNFWTERRARAMGSTVHLLVGADDSGALADRALAEIERLERCWTRFRPDSELCRLNAARGTGKVRVSPTLWAGVSAAYDLWCETDGWFDPTVIDCLERTGYDRTFGEVSSDGPAPERGPQPTPGLAAVVLDASHRSVQLPPGVRIDLGGVGKGLAADLVADLLIDAGARSVCVSLGGDVRVAGEAPEGAWRIPVEHPVGDGVAFDAAVPSGAVVTSTVRYRGWWRGGRRFHHLIDPTTGDPADRGLHSVVVAAATAARAEGLAKAALVAGTEVGAALVCRPGVQAWLFDGGGRCRRLDRERAVR